MNTPVLGDLLETHWPDWATNSRAVAIRDRIAEVKGTFYSSNEAVTEFNGYQLTMVASPKYETPWHCAYYPKLYRPILRFLLCKIAFLSVCLTVEPVIKDKARKKKYNIYQDGLLRNLIYNHSILDTFYNWLRDTYYPGLDYDVIIPPDRPMSFKRCHALDSWLVHEFVLAGNHSPGGVSSGMNDPNVKELWDQNWDALKIGMIVHLFNYFLPYIDNH